MSRVNPPSRGVGEGGQMAIAGSETEDKWPAGLNLGERVFSFLAGEGERPCPKRNRRSLRPFLKAHFYND